MWHSLFQTPVYIIKTKHSKNLLPRMVFTMWSSRSHPLNLGGAEHNDASFFLYSYTLYRRIEVWVMTRFPMMPEWCPITSTHLEFWKLDSTRPLHWRFQIHSCTFIGYICLKYSLSALARMRKLVKTVIPWLKVCWNTLYVYEECSMKRVGCLSHKLTITRTNKTHIKPTDHLLLFYQRADISVVASLWPIVRIEGDATLHVCLVNTCFENEVGGVASSNLSYSMIQLTNQENLLLLPPCGCESK